MPDMEPMQNLISELRRGSLTLAVLGSLREPRYGYALLQVLQEQKIDIEANTLYPLLRRLESQELLTSDWDTSESRPRKYYTVSAKGQEVLEQLLGEWERMQSSIASICGKGRKE
jgi:PadR family transcriptional regulator, regulatory protein PadR